jgi:serine protease Do
MAVAALAVVTLSFGACGVVLSQDNYLPKYIHPLTQLPPEGLRSVAFTPRLLQQSSPLSFADLVEQVSPAVVTVTVQHTANQQQMSAMGNIPTPFQDFSRDFGGQGQSPGRGGQNPNQRTPRTFQSQAMGSGFIIDRSGYIVTNNHVIEDGSRISVRLPSGREYQAKLIGADKDTDVALIKVDGVTDLPVVELGNDRSLRVGDWVVAVGNPFGLGGTVTAGIVSSIGRDIGNGPYTDYIQIDAPINQGNSGGPTFDLSGRVIGMNTAIFSPSGGSVGIGSPFPPRL